MQTLINWFPITEISPENKKLYRTIIKTRGRSEFETICSFNEDWREYVDENNGKMYSPEEIRLISLYETPQESVEVITHKLGQAFWEEKRRADLAEKRLNTVNISDADCWSWQENCNFLESMSGSAVIKIRAGELRKLLLNRT